MKLIRPNTKKKERLVYGFVAVLVVGVLVIWGFQVKEMFIAATQVDLENQKKSFNEAMEFADLMEIGGVIKEKNPGEYFEQIKLTVEEESIKNEALEAIAADIVSELNAEDQLKEEGVNLEVSPEVDAELVNQISEEIEQ